MRRYLQAAMVGLVFAGAVASATARAQGCDGAITPDDIERAEDARYTAQTHDDFDAMEKLFGEDLVYIHSSAVVDNKASYIDSMHSGNVKYRVMRRSGVTVRTYGCLGILTGNANFDVTVKGQDVNVQLRFTSIWAKRGERVQFVGWQATRIPPK